MEEFSPPAGGCWPSVGFACRPRPPYAQYPVNRYGDDDTGIMQWLIVLGALMLLGVVSMMNPKRSHKD